MSNIDEMSQRLMQNSWAAGAEAMRITAAKLLADAGCPRLATRILDMPLPQIEDFRAPPQRQDAPPP